MASRTTVTLDNLAALGPERLAAILIEFADGDAEVKRRLRLELAAQAGGDAIAGRDRQAHRRPAVRTVLHRLAEAAGLRARPRPAAGDDRGPGRAHLKRLPDFDDVEDRAKRHALGFRSFPAALHFFQDWPDQACAARLVLTRAPEIDGNLYVLLDPAARRVEGRHPLAAALLRRAMIEDTLAGANSTRCKHAARHRLECASLAPGIRDFGASETHDAFVGRLRAKHDRKAGFWGQP